MSLNTCAGARGPFLTDDLCVKVALELSYGAAKVVELVDFV
jgi:hypothetical protein